MKDSEYVWFNSVNRCCLIISDVDGCIEESKGNKHLILDSTDKNEKIFEKYIKFWDGITNLIECNSIEKANNKIGEYEKYEKNFMKIKFNWHNNLPLNKTLKIQNVTIVIRSLFEEDVKYCPQFF